MKKRVELTGAHTLSRVREGGGNLGRGKEKNHFGRKEKSRLLAYRGGLSQVDSLQLKEVTLTDWKRAPIREQHLDF